jgi:hypothetical protein
MNLTDFLIMTAFALLTLMALPMRRLRRALLYLLLRGGHLATFAGITCCGLFAFRPELAPQALRDTLASAVPQVDPALTWLGRALLLLILALPVLIHLEYARELEAHSTFLRLLRQGLSVLASNDRPTEIGTPVDTTIRPRAPEVAVAVEAIRAAAGTARGHQPVPRKLVKDLLDESR